MQPRSNWDELDFLLFEAFDIYEDENVEGIPAWMRYRTDGGALFTVDTGIDAATAVLDEWDKKNEKKKKPGQYRFPVMVDMNGERRDVGGLDRDSFYTGTPIGQSPRGDSVPDLLDDLGIQRTRPPGGYNTSEYGDPM